VRAAAALWVAFTADALGKPLPRLRCWGFGGGKSRLLRCLAGWSVPPAGGSPSMARTLFDAEGGIDCVCAGADAACAAALRLFPPLPVAGNVELFAASLPG